MRTRRSHRLLFVLTLVLSQWLVLAHALGHPALAVDLQCQVCLHAPGIDGGALAGKPATLPLGTQTASFPILVARAPAVARIERERIRGPPLSVA